MTEKLKNIKVKVHYPDTKEGKEKLKEKVSMLHSDYIINYLNDLNICEKQKVKIINEILKNQNDAIN